MFSFLPTRKEQWSLRARRSAHCPPPPPNPRIPNKTVTPQPTFPLDTTTDGGCDTVGTQHKAWTRQIATLQLHDSDFLITAVVSECVSTALRL